MGLTARIVALVAVGFALAVLPATHAAAQSSEMRQMLKRVERLQRELSTLQQHVYKGTRPPAPAPGTPQSFSGGANTRTGSAAGSSADTARKRTPGDDRPHRRGPARRHDDRQASRQAGLRRRFQAGGAGTEVVRGRTAGGDSTDASAAAADGLRGAEGCGAERGGTGHESDSPAQPGQHTEIRIGQPAPDRQAGGGRQGRQREAAGGRHC